MTANNFTPAFPAPRHPLAPAPKEGLAKTQETHSPEELKGRDNLVHRINILGDTLQSAMGIREVQITGADYFHSVTGDTARCLLISHALDPRDAIVTAGAGLKAARKPNGEWQVLSPLMREGTGFPGKVENLMTAALGVAPHITHVKTPGSKRLSGEALAASKVRNQESLEEGKRRLIREGGVQIIFPQGNVKGPGPIDIAGVGAVKAFSQHEGKPLVFIPAGITYEPLVPSHYGVRENIKAFYNVGKPVVVQGPVTDEALARALELELAKVHTFTASGIAGAHVFKRRDDGKRPTLFEGEFKALVTRVVDELIKYDDVNVDAPLRDPAVRDSYLSESYKAFVARGFVDAETGAVRNVGNAADFDQAPKLRSDARAEGVVLSDPLRFNGNRVRQVLRASPALQFVFDAASDAIPVTSVRRKSDELRDACAVM